MKIPWFGKKATAESTVLALSKGFQGLVVESPEQARAWMLAWLDVRRAATLPYALPGMREKSATTRARVATLLPDEREHFLGTRVGHHVDAVRRLRERHGVIWSRLLDDVRDRDILALPVRLLSRDQARHVALSLALEIDEPSVVVLFEPYDALRDHSRAAELAQRMLDLAARVPFLLLDTDATSLDAFGARRALEEKSLPTGAERFRILVPREYGVSTLLPGARLEALVEYPRATLVEVSGISAERLQHALAQSGVLQLEPSPRKGSA